MTSTRTIPREIEIIRLLIEGKSYKGIAALLGMIVGHSLLYQTAMVCSIPPSFEGLGPKNDLANRCFLPTLSCSKEIALGTGLGAAKEGKMALDFL
jgi:disulfide bond formation protein DsbB